MPDAQRDLVDAVRDAFKIGIAGEHPAVAIMREHIADDPEYGFHYGSLLESLEDLEGKILTLMDANQKDPELKDRLKITLNRPIPGDEAVDARLDASSIYQGITRYAYGRNGVQAFIETDILSSGTLGEPMVLELDYVFPDTANHILSVVEYTAPV